MKHDAAPQDTASPQLPGRIDLHSHLLPGIDDGCATVEESLDSIRTLIEHGYVGTVCTPHLWEIYPANIPMHIAAWVGAMRQEIVKAELDYALWPGGELRICDEAIGWMQVNDVPSLAGSRYVLCDFWTLKWGKFIDRTFDWLLEQGYTPILAHPERSPTQDKFEKHLDQWQARGVLLQGNFQCFTGEAGYRADTLVRQYMDESRYDLLALDMHRPDTLAGRVDGIKVAAKEYGSERIEALIDAGRELLWPTSAVE